MPTRLSHVHGLARAVGIAKAAHILIARLVGYKKSIPTRPKKVSVGSIEVRPQDSDLFVLSQIFGWAEYDIGDHRRNLLIKHMKAVLDRGNQPIIVDAGSNVGYSALYFAEMYPDAVVLAVEPSIDAFQQTRRNCAINKRIKPVHAALWLHDGGVEILGTTSSSWSNRVQDADGPNRVASMRLEQLLTLVPQAELVLLKLDIEGAEREVCQTSANIIRDTPCILVEPHDFKFPGAACLTPLFSAIAGKRVDTLLIGENLLLFDADLGSAT
jgi:FkbM family methyltransferase